MYTSLRMYFCMSTNGVHCTFEIMIDGERIYVPVRANFSIEHERGNGEEEVEFQFKWLTDK